MSEIDPQEFGRLTAKVEHLEAEVHQLRKDVKDLRFEIMGSLNPLLQLASEARGGWKAMLVLGGIAGAVGASFGKLAGWWLDVGPKG